MSNSYNTRKKQKSYMFNKTSTWFILCSKQIQFRKNNERECLYELWISFTKESGVLRKATHYKKWHRPKVHPSRESNPSSWIIFNKILMSIMINSVQLINKHNSHWTSWQLEMLIRKNLQNFPYHQRPLRVLYSVLQCLSLSVQCFSSIYLLFLWGLNHWPNIHPKFHSRNQQYTCKP
jgi:hypothetical protein